MAFLTESDLKRIAKYLANNGIKDSQFDDSNYPFTGDEYVVLVKDNVNKKIKIKDLILSTGDTTVGENGNWFYKGEDTGIRAQGPQGDSFTYDDFTDEQIEELKKPAYEASESLNTQFTELSESVNQQLEAELNELQVLKESINENIETSNESINTIDKKITEADSKINEIDSKIEESSTVIEETNKAKEEALKQANFAKEQGESISDKRGVGKTYEGSNGTGEIFNNYNRNIATGEFSHAEGDQCSATGVDAHAEGYACVAEGKHSHAEGNSCRASSLASHAEGKGCVASGEFSHAEGDMCISSGNHSHAEGTSCESKGVNSHAEGDESISEGEHSHAEGYRTTAKGDNSHSQNNKTTANCFSSTAIGCRNKVHTKYPVDTYNAEGDAFVVGNGNIGSNLEGDALVVKFNGETHSDLLFTSPSTGYAELFKWEDENTLDVDRVGLFVTLVNDKIKVVDSDSAFILGVVSPIANIIGGNPLSNINRYINDEWGRPIYEDKLLGDGIRYQHIRKLNSEYNSTLEFTPYLHTKEYGSIVLLGQVLVKQDGTLTAGSFCKSNSAGIATKSESGYYVMKVINDGQALILFK